MTDVQFRKDHLWPIFHELAQSKYRCLASAGNARDAVTDVPGVAVFDSGVEGKTVGITICTHGNEPAGLLAYAWFRDALQDRERAELLLPQGKVIFALNNLAATEAYLNAETDKDKRLARYVDVDMNRLPADLADHRSEVCRARELLPVWRQFDLSLDIHTTSQEAPPMLVAQHTDDVRYATGFPMSRVITNIQNIQINRPASAFTGGLTGAHAPNLVIEAGAHECSLSVRRAQLCIKSLILNAITDPHYSHDVTEVAKPLQEYWIDASIMFDDYSYKFEKVFENFMPLDAGTIIAQGDGDPIRMPFDGHILFAPKTRCVDYIETEAAFISRRSRDLPLEALDDRHVAFA